MAVGWSRWRIRASMPVCSNLSLKCNSASFCRCIVTSSGFALSPQEEFRVTLLRLPTEPSIATRSPAPVLLGHPKRTGRQFDLTPGRQCTARSRNGNNESSTVIKPCDAQIEEFQLRQLLRWRPPAAPWAKLNWMRRKRFRGCRGKVSTRESARLDEGRVTKLARSPASGGRIASRYGCSIFARHRFNRGRNCRHSWLQ